MKKLLALLLITLMIAAVFPISAFADGETGDDITIAVGEKANISFVHADSSYSSSPTVKVACEGNPIVSATGQCSVFHFASKKASISAEVTGVTPGTTTVYVFLNDKPVATRKVTVTASATPAQEEPAGDFSMKIGETVSYSVVKYDSTYTDKTKMVPENYGTFAKCEYDNAFIYKYNSGAINGGTVISTIKFTGQTAGTMQCMAVIKSVNVDVRNITVMPEGAYRINYVLNSGKNNAGNPDWFNGTDAVTLKDATRSGYVFTGWYTEKGLVNKVTTLSANGGNDVTLYAGWVKKTALSDCKVSLEYTSAARTGKALKPAVTVKLSDGSVVDKANYTVTYSNNTNIGKATVKIAASDDGILSGSVSKTFTINPAATTIKSLTNTTDGIKLSWSKVTGATGYKIYRSKGTGSYKLLKTITDGAIVSYTDESSMTNGTRYRYKIVAVAEVSGTTYKSAYSGVATTYRLSRPSISSAKNSESKKITVKWEENSKASGYEIKYVKGDTTKTVTVTKASTVSKVISSLTKGSTYKISIRAYKTVDGVKYYSAWSAAKSVKVTQ